MRYTLTLCLIALMAMTGCSSDQVISSLELSVDAVSAALPLIGPTAGLPAPLQTAIQTYLGATSDAIASASDILAGPGTDAAKTATIVASFAAIATPSVPAQYQSVATAVQQVALLVAKFIAQLPSATTTAKPVGASAFLPSPSADAGKTTNWTAAQKKKLAAIKAKATAASKAAKGGK